MEKLILKEKKERKRSWKLEAAKIIKSYNIFSKFQIDHKLKSSKF